MASKHVIVATESDLEIARRGGMIQLDALVPEDVRKIFLDNGGREVLELAARVIAQERAQVRFYESIINKDMNS